ncbi:hypothetical protein GWI33_003317, partial [Rhynchophorus ferrugineus]
SRQSSLNTNSRYLNDADLDHQMKKKSTYSQNSYCSTKPVKTAADDQSQT